MRQKQKIAVLGAGPAGLAAAYRLASGENRGKYDITVYQMGSRLGGKWFVRNLVQVTCCEISLLQCHHSRSWESNSGTWHPHVIRVCKPVSLIL